MTHFPMSTPLRHLLLPALLLFGSVHAFAQSIATPAPMSGLLSELKQNLPDETEVQRLQVSGDQIQLQGLSSNVQALRKSLSHLQPWQNARESLSEFNPPEAKRQRFQLDARRIEDPMTVQSSVLSADSVDIALDQALAQARPHVGNCRELTRARRDRADSRPIAVVLRLRCPQELLSMLPLVQQIEQGEQPLRVEELALYRGIARLTAAGQEAAPSTDIRLTVSAP